MLGQRLLPIAMEDDAALPGQDLIDASLAKVDEADAYVGLIGYRYGQMPESPERNPDRLSLTELEFHRAVTRGIPICMFIMHKDYLVPRSAVGEERGAEQKLEAFLNLAKKDRIYAEFKSVEDLKTKAVQSLVALREVLDRRASASLSTMEPAHRARERQRLEPDHGQAEPRGHGRRLRIYAYDPNLQTDPTLFDSKIATVTTVSESDLKPGPVGEYIEVVDVDPASRAWYEPVNLNDPGLMAKDGLTPSESNPQFHQQMAYAVAMLTIERFERALGRKVLWARRRPRNEGEVVPDNGFVRRLRIYPHALREANAYYDPDKIALLFGYFQAADSSGAVTRGSGVFGVVSHDIVAHETTHALLDGLHPRYSEPTNVDMAAFHEAFADIVALFQHFAMPELLTRQIRQARGSTADIGRKLGQLAQQFGEATVIHGALRRYVGEVGSATPMLKDDMRKPHERAAVLVSAVFAAFLTIYELRCAELIRQETNGTGILPYGDISVQLANRLASEASKTAEHVLNMCIRALDYCPPVNLEFGDFLRAIITADHDLFPDDDRGYRDAFIDAFRERGIFPYDVRRLAEDSLLWEPPPMDDMQLGQFTELLTLLDLSLTDERRAAFDRSQYNSRKLNAWLIRSEHALLRKILGFEEPAKRWTGRIIEYGYALDSSSINWLCRGQGICRLGFLSRGADRDRRLAASTSGTAGRAIPMFGD